MQRFQTRSIALSLLLSSCVTSLVTTFIAMTPQVASAQARNNACVAQLDSRIDRVLDRIPGQWSVLVQTQGAVGARENLYARNPGDLLTPASNNKVFTTAAALAKLGSRFQLRTPVTGNSTGPELATLRIIGQGDPSFSTGSLRSITQQLRSRGVQRVNLLIGDDTVFQGEPFNPFWASRHRGEGYAAPVNSLLINENNIYDSSVPNPGNYLVGEFRQMLTRSGIKVVSSTLVKRTPAPPGEVELANVISPPLANLIAITNQDSNNVYAESLFKTLGRTLDPNTRDSSASGAEAVRSILMELGVNPNRFSLVDGSGLAERNRASAEALVQTLQAMALHPESEVFRRSLAVAGRTGTLQNRLTSLSGQVIGKTGTLRGAVSLSGYINVPGRSPLVFGAIANSTSSASSIRAAIDEMVVILARTRNC